MTYSVLGFPSLFFSLFLYRTCHFYFFPLFKRLSVWLDAWVCVEFSPVVILPLCLSVSFSPAGVHLRSCSDMHMCCPCVSESVSAGVLALARVESLAGVCRCSTNHSPRPPMRLPTPPPLRAHTPLKTHLKSSGTTDTSPFTT